MNNIDQNDLNYRVSGNGCPVVFLHGFLESLNMWDHLEFSEGIQRIQFDLPGHGSSGFDSDTVFSMEALALKVQESLDGLNIDSYHVVGHSMGGYVGLELMKNDSRCQKLILLNSNFWADSESKKKDRLRVAKIVETNKELFVYEAIPNLFLNPERHDRFVRKLINEAIQIDSSAIVKASLSIGSRKNNTDFVKLNFKNILVIQGEQDPIVSCEKMLAFTSLNNMNVLVVRDCGHMGHIEQSGTIVKEIESFLK